jgi:hypothetical protein
LIKNVEASSFDEEKKETSNLTNGAKPKSHTSRILNTITMKHLTLITLFAFASQLSFAQGGGKKSQVGTVDPFIKTKLIRKLNKLAIAQITVNYKITTEERVIGKEKRSGSVAGAKITAYLQTTDGDLTENDLQEVTDYFYSYFQKKLKASGIDTVGWSTIAATDFYKSNKVDEEKDGGERAGNVWVTRTANNGNTIYGGGLAFTFSKAKRASRFSKEIGAPAAYFYITLDFADVMVNVDVKTSTSSSLYYTTNTRSTRFKSAVNPEMKVVTSNQYSLFWNAKSQAESLILRQDLESVGGYSDNISEDASKGRSGLAKAFAFRKEMTPVVIETTREKYKAAAKKALEKYADAFVEKAKSGK